MNTGEQEQARRNEEIHRVESAIDLVATLRDRIQPGTHESTRLQGLRVIGYEEREIAFTQTTQDLLNGLESFLFHNTHQPNIFGEAFEKSELLIDPVKCSEIIEILKMRYLSGMPFKQIQNSLGKNRGFVEGRRNYGLQVLTSYIQLFEVGAKEYHILLSLLGLPD